MGIEYFLVKPEKKEIFYLGKHFNGFNEIKSTKYYESLDRADYPSYEDWDDFFWDTLKENWLYFLHCELTLEQTSDLIHEIYEWCTSDKVILDNDCSPTAAIWKAWKETGDISAILENLHSTKEAEEYNKEALQECLEENESIIFSNPSYNSSIIGVTTDGRAVYDFNLMIKEFATESNVTDEEAVEFIEYNTLGSLPQAETKYPIIIYNRKDMI